MRFEVCVSVEGVSSNTGTLDDLVQWVELEFMPYPGLLLGHDWYVIVQRVMYDFVAKKVYVYAVWDESQQIAPVSPWDGLISDGYSPEPRGGSHNE